MGLITLAPPSTIAALELLDPVDGQLHDPEAELGDETEWLLFAGETLAFLTGGQLHAPLHRVPWVERGSRPARCATPFFLRAAPWAVLTDPTGSIEITCRQLMERHCAARRPWRLQRAGSLNTGDW
jgi:isopenicillin N synthase-like dioxygenase